MLKRRLSLLVAGVLLSSCQIGLNRITPPNTPAVTSTLVEGSPIPRFQRWSVQQVLDAFTVAGLEVENVRFNDPFYLYGAPTIAVEYAQFFTPSWGRDAGGLIFAFASQSDLDAVYKFYKDLGWYEGPYYPWVTVKDNILLQITGILSDIGAEKYQFVLLNLK
jgi:hypothetical protein